MKKQKLIEKILRFVQEGIFREAFPFAGADIRFSGQEDGEKWWITGGNTDDESCYRFFRVMENVEPRLTLEFCTRKDFGSCADGTETDILWYDLQDCDCRTLKEIIRIAEERQNKSIDNN